MTGKEETPVAPDQRPPRPATPFIVEDRTDAATQNAMAEAFAAWHWVHNQRALGHKPN